MHHLFDWERICSSCDEPTRFHWTASEHLANHTYRHIPAAFGPVYAEENHHYRAHSLIKKPLRVEEQGWSLPIRLYEDGWMFGAARQPYDLECVHRFCNKTCPIYYTPAHRGPWRVYRKLYDQCYAAWFRHGKEIYRHDAFLVQALDVSTMFENVLIGKCESSTTGQLRNIVGVHKQICDTVQKRKKEFDDTESRPEHEPDFETWRRGGPDWGCYTRSHYWSRDKFSLLPSYRRFFIIIDTKDPANEGMTLVRVDSKRTGEPEWNYNETAGVSWWRASIPEVLDKLLKGAGLPPSAYPDIMQNGEVEHPQKG